MNLRILYIVQGNWIRNGKLNEHACVLYKTRINEFLKKGKQLIKEWCL